MKPAAGAGQERPRGPGPGVFPLLLGFPFLVVWVQKKEKFQNQLIRRIFVPWIIPGLPFLSSLCKAAGPAEVGQRLHARPSDSLPAPPIWSRKRPPPPPLPPPPPSSFVTMNAAPVTLRRCHAGRVPDLGSGTLLLNLFLAASQRDTWSHPHSADGGHSGLGFAWDLWPGGDEAGSHPWAGCL